MGTDRENLWYINIYILFFMIETINKIYNIIIQFVVVCCLVWSTNTHTKPEFSLSLHCGNYIIHIILPSYMELNPMTILKGKRIKWNYYDVFLYIIHMSNAFEHIFTIYINLILLCAFLAHWVQLKYKFIIYVRGILVRFPQLILLASIKKNETFSRMCN